MGDLTMKISPEAREQMLAASAAGKAGMPYKGQYRTYGVTVKLPGMRQEDIDFNNLKEAMSFISSQLKVRGAFASIVKMR